VEFPTIVQNDGHGTGSASPNPARAGQTVTLTSTPSSGYRFKEWQVVSPAGQQIVISGNSFTMPADMYMVASEVIVKAVFEPTGGGGTGGAAGSGVAPAGLGGSFSGGSAYGKGSSTGIVYNVNKDFSLFNNVVVDSTTLTLNRDYTAVEGSTRISLLPAYLDTLNVGTHTLRVNFKDNTYATASFTVTAAVMGVMPTMPVNPFTDVTGTDWFIDSVIYVFDKGLMTGTSTSPMLFSPNNPTTRGMIVTILHRLEGNPSISGLTNPFDDVASGQWYSDAVIWAAANGIVSGYGGGKFSPEDNITREQLAAILNNYAGKTGAALPGARDYPGFYDDAAIAGWAQAAVTAFYKAGIINGKPNNLFDPKGNATRAEVATMMMNFLELFNNQ
jgi:hypothetical protein